MGTGILTGTLFMAASLSWTSAAWACGYYAMDQDIGTGALESADFRAIYVVGSESTTAVIQASYVGERPSFAWIIPVPGLLERGEVGVVSSSAIDEIVWATDPKYTWSPSCTCVGMGMYGCSAGGSDKSGTASVNVLDTFDVGPYELIYLDAAESADLTGYLQDAGYQVPSAAENILDLYLSEGWTFLIARIGDAPDARDSANALPALAFSYAGTTPAYPLRISRASAGPEVETLIVTIAAHRLEPQDDPWTTPRLGRALMGEDFTNWYEARARLAIEDAGGKAWLLEYANHYDSTTFDTGWRDTNDYVGGSMLVDELVGLGLLDTIDAVDLSFVTRYRSWLTPDQMDIDLRLVPADNNDTYVVGMTSGLQGSGFPFLPIAWLGLGAGWGLARRRRPPHSRGPGG